MSTPHQPQDAWRECRPGELGEIAGALRTRKRNRTIVKVAAATTVAVLLLMAGGYAARSIIAPSTPGHNGSSFAGISCRDVKTLLPDLKRGGLSTEKSSQVMAHLEMCPRCQAAYDRMQAARVKRGRPGDSAVAALNR